MELFTDEQFVKYHIPAHSDDWFNFRTIGYNDPDSGEFYPGGIGASESSKLFADVNPYRPLLQEMFYHKIGMESPNRIDNENTYWGTQDEPGIIFSWQFWDGTEGGYVDNYRKWVNAGKPDKLILRKAVECKYYLVNKKFPWLFVSLDSAIPPGSMNMITREPLKCSAPLEAKTIGYYAARNWEDKVPKYHIIQLHHQMLVTESDYGEIVLKRDGQKLDVKYYQRDEKLCQAILEKSNDFWNNRVMPARALYDKMLQADTIGNSLEVERNLGKIQMLEPEPDSSELYKEYQAEKYGKERNYRKGKIKEYSALRRIMVLKYMEKAIKERKTWEENQIREIHKKEMVEDIVFQNNGHFSYRPFRDTMRLYPKLNDEIDEELIKNELRKMNIQL